MKQYDCVDVAVVYVELPRVHYTGVDDGKGRIGPLFPSSPSSK